MGRLEHVKKVLTAARQLGTMTARHDDLGNVSGTCPHRALVQLFWVFPLCWHDTASSLILPWIRASKIIGPSNGST